MNQDLQQELAKLREIKPLLEIEDYSLYVFLGVLGIVLVAIFCIYSALRYGMALKRSHVFRKNIAQFCDVNYVDVDSKNFAYESTNRLHAILSNIERMRKKPVRNWLDRPLRSIKPDDLEKLEKSIDEVLEELALYKYKPQSSKLSADDKVFDKYLPLREALSVYL